jgi:large subunit ribosomal protein L25
MSKQFKIPAELRADVGKGASRRLRRAGRIPAVVYGAERDPASITVDHDSVLHMAENDAFFASILELRVADGQRQKVVVRDLQRHPFKPLLTHIDFLRVREDEPVRVNVPIHFVNEDASKAGRKAGVVISYQAMEVEIDALPKDLPESLEVDLAELEPGDSVMLSEVRLPEGVTVPALEVGEDNDHPVVTAIFIREGQGSGEMAAESDAVAGEPVDVDTVADDEAADEAEGDDDAGTDNGDSAEGEDAKSA